MVVPLYFENSASFLELKNQTKSQQIKLLELSIRIHCLLSVLFVPNPIGGGGGTIYSNGFYFLQMILADRYIL